MATHQREEYSCDNCHKTLKTSGTSIDIMTSKRENNPWSRLHVQIKHRHGYHNDSETDDADLCQKCAIKLLTDALQRVKNGERATKGTESSEQGNWE